jgi:prepilin-type N-terminal cleavage/methylation domain-containing protein
MKLHLPRKPRGFSLIEVMIAMSISSLILGAAYTSIFTVQRMVKSSVEYSTSKTTQLRLSDYVARDLRCALRIKVYTVAADADGDILEVELPDYYDENNKPVTPAIAKYTVNYGNPAVPVKIRYYKYQGKLFRKEDNLPAQEVADDVKDFEIVLSDLNKVITTQITFTSSLTGIKSADAQKNTTVYNTTLLRNKRRDR